MTIDTLRHMFEHNSRFLELSLWVMEVLIVSMIAYEVGAAVLHKWQTKRRFKQLYKLMQEGQTLTLPGTPLKVSDPRP